MKNFFNQLQRSVLWAALPGNFIALVMIWQADFSIYLQALVSVLLILVVLVNLYYLFDKLNEQFLSLANLVEALNVGDYTLRAKGAAESSALGDLVQQINRLADNLSTTRFEYKESQLLLAKLIKQIGVIIFACDENQKITLANPAAERFFEKSESKLINHTLADLNLVDLIDAPNNQLVMVANKQASSRLHLYRDNFREAGKQHDLFILSDLETVLSHQEQKAWKDLVRVLSHEINNSLSPIISLTDTLNKISSSLPIDGEDKEDIQGGLTIIGERATRLKSFIQGYRQLATLPEPQKKQHDLGKIISSSTELLGYSCNLQLADNCIVEVDAAQLEQCLINLLKNAHEAAPQQTIDVSLKQDEQQVVIEIKDLGAGISNPDNLFVPLYTTKKQGTGTGLALCRQIVSAHNGVISLSNHPERGCVAKVVLPVN
ncbi:sensor histidine kinase [Pseudoalteromonas spongiae]|uniref:sensor histidine kinase n=1 Tax=Pseudoalteromonas spongiae TaxID=298657 RepID=UPI000C2CEB15|nr:ATP-binding protein [Pseudoalteromonas spongiae]